MNILTKWVRRIIRKLVCAGLMILSFSLSVSASAQDIDWDSVESTSIKTFYPGVASWDFVKGKDHGTGANPVIKGKKSCAVCHVNKKGKYDIASDEIISGELLGVDSEKPIEPKPIANMEGYKDVALQTAYDAENIYIRLQWLSAGSSFNDPTLTENGLTDRISIQFSNKIKTFNKYGCYISCHDDQKGMPKSRGGEQKLYGYYARSKGQAKPAEKLAEYLSKGQFIDLWIAAFEGKKINTTDQYILEDRIDDQNDVTSTGGFADGKYTIVLQRKLATGDSHDIQLKEGSKVTVSIAIHDFLNHGRKHYTSFPVSIGLSATADINAKKL